jgi:hypothetical protein
MANGSDKQPTNTAMDMTVAVVLLLAIFAIGGALVGTGGNFLETYDKMVEWFYSSGFRKFLNTVAVIFAVINATLLTFIIWVLRKHNELRKKPLPADEIVPSATQVIFPQKEVADSWGRIKELANSKNPSDWNMAVLRADSLLDEILGLLGNVGETFAEKLKIVDPTKLVSLDRVWSAHRLRNAIAHDPLEQHTKETIIHALRSYEQALKELGMME